MDECLKHVETTDRADAGIIELRFPEAAPVSQHGQETRRVSSYWRVKKSVEPSVCSPGLLPVPLGIVPGVREIDLRQDLNHGSPARLEDSDVVLCVETAVPERQDGSAPTLVFGRLREYESLQVPLLALAQSGQWPRALAQRVLAVCRGEDSPAPYQPQR